MNSSSTALLITLVICSISGYAQNVKSGIGTINPQQTLHVAGATDKPGTKVGTTTNVYVIKPTIKVDGLNSTNNDAHSPADGTNSLRRVYATATNGDLILLKSSVEQLTPAVQEFNTISTQTANAIAGILGGETPVLISKTFTLNQPSIVNFSASVGVTMQTGITDGRAKLYGAYFRFSTVPVVVPAISTAAKFGINQKTYTNYTATGVIDNLMLAPRADLVLPAGTYTVNLYGYINSADIAFSATFGSTNGENIIITAHPQQF